MKPAHQDEARRLPPLDSLRVFEAAARHGAFAKAAEELHLTASAVSHRMAALEAALGVALFERRGRRVAPTASGRDYAAAIGAALGQLRAATRRIAAPSRAGPLAVSVTPLFAMRWLLPRLAGFEAAHPAVPVRLHASMRLVDFATDEVDLAVRFGRGEWQGLVAERLFGFDLVPVAAPALTKGPRALKAPADLARATLLHAENTADFWRLWLTAAGLSGIDAERGRRFQDAPLSIQAALAGLGVALADPRFVADDLAAGRLVVPFDIHAATQGAFHLVYREGALADPRIASFRTWLLAEVAADKGAAPAGRAARRRRLRAA